MYWKYSQFIVITMSGISLQWPQTTETTRECVVKSSCALWKMDKNWCEIMIGIMKPIMKPNVKHIIVCARIRSAAICSLIVSGNATTDQVWIFTWMSIYSCRWMDSSFLTLPMKSKIVQSAYTLLLSNIGNIKHWNNLANRQVAPQT